MAKRRQPAVSKVVLTLQAEAKRQGITASKLAKMTGLSLQTMQRLIAGEGSPTVATLDAVAHALGMEVRAMQSCTDHAH